MPSVAPDPVEDTDNDPPCRLGEVVVAGPEAVIIVVEVERDVMEGNEPEVKGDVPPLLSVSPVVVEVGALRVCVVLGAVRAEVVEEIKVLAPVMMVGVGGARVLGIIAS